MQVYGMYVQQYVTMGVFTISFIILQGSYVTERTVTVRIPCGHSHVGVLMDVTQILETV